MIKNKLFIIISLFLVSCGTLNYPSEINSAVPVIATGLLQVMKNYPSAISYMDLINGSYQW